MVRNHYQLTFYFALQAGSGQKLLLRKNKVNGCLIFALTTCRLDVVLPPITGLNPSWTRHLQNVSHTHMIFGHVSNRD